MKKKINWTLFNAALLTELLLSYLLPFHVVEKFQYSVGFPISFLSLYDTEFQKTPFLSMHLNPIALLCDVAILYGVFFLLIKGCKRGRMLFRRQEKK